jgi:phage gp36-like protein
MSYTTLQELVDRYGEERLVQLTDRSMAEVIDQAVLLRAIADADAEIDGYLAARYRLPLASVPPVLTRIAPDIVFYRLHSDEAPEEVRTRYEDARRLLEGISRGSVGLGVPETEDQPRPSLASASSGNPRIMDRSGTEGL